jgi:hypothetical protein
MAYFYNVRRGDIPHAASVRVCTPTRRQLRAVCARSTRQQFWENSPEGWPQRFDTLGEEFRLDGRPTAQWSPIRAGRDDNLGGSMS